MTEDIDKLEEEFIKIKEKKTMDYFGATRIIKGGEETTGGLFRKELNKQFGKFCYNRATARIVGIIEKRIKLYEDKITAKKLPSYPPYVLEDLLKEPNYL